MRLMAVVQSDLDLHHSLMPEHPFLRHISFDFTASSAIINIGSEEEAAEVKLEILQHQII